MSGDLRSDCPSLYTRRMSRLCPYTQVAVERCWKSGARTSRRVSASKNVDTCTASCFSGKSRGDGWLIYEIRVARIRVLLLLSTIITPFCSVHYYPQNTAEPGKTCYFPSSLLLGRTGNTHPCTLRRASGHPVPLDLAIRSCWALLLSGLDITENFREGNFTVCICRINLWPFLHSTLTLKYAK